MCDLVGTVVYPEPLDDLRLNRQTRRCQHHLHVDLGVTGAKVVIPPPSRSHLA